MGKKSSPAPPAAPDPVATANAQAAANTTAAETQANLDRINQVSNTGSSIYTKTGTNSDGTPQYTQTTTLSPVEQQKYDQANQVSLALGNLADKNISSVAQAQSTPFNYNSETPLQTSANSGQYQLQAGPTQANPVQTSIANPGAITQAQQGAAGTIAQMQAGAGGPIAQMQAGAGGPITQAQIGYGGPITSLSNGAGGNIQTALNYSGLSALPGQGDLLAAGNQAANALYSQAASRLDPQWSLQDEKTNASLAAQGISANSAAYQRAQQQEYQAKNDAYNQANYSAIQAGGAEQSRLFGIGLQTQQQQQNLIDTQGNFANAAQAQGYGQALSTAQQQDAAQAQTVQQYMDAINQQNAAQAQGYGQTLSTTQQQDAAQAQGYGQTLSTTQQQDAAQAQQYAQYMATIQQQNDAQNQTYTQAQGDAALYNAGNAQQFSQNQAAAAMNNAAQTSAFNQSAANVSLNNAARTQQIQEQTYLRDMPLNDIASLLGTGPGVAQPTFSAVPQVGVAAPDYQGIVSNNYNQAVSQYNTAQQAQASMLGSIFGAAGTIGSAFVPKPSDIRLKTDIRPIGVLANGIPTYAFKYIGSNLEQFGVMAHEVFKVIPDAVSIMPNGYMAVDYRKVYA